MSTLKKFPKGKLDKVHQSQLESLKGFKKAGKGPESQWLTKRNSVRQTHER